MTGAEAVLVSDEETHSGAAALCVSVGQLDDPPGRHAHHPCILQPHVFSQAMMQTADFRIRIVMYMVRKLKLGKIHA